MPQSIEKYKIFVASPSDVKNDRDSITEVIAELNSTYCSRANIILEVVKWETHSAPGVSYTQVQDVIDSDIGNDYDLFIGLLWKKFGTPTMDYDSGTEQEFENAYSRFKESPKALQILFYFNTSLPISLNDIDPAQLEKVNKFKNKIGAKSVLYWEYNTNEDLQKFLRIHIPKRIDELRNIHNSQKSTDAIVLDSILDESDFEELGLLDYQDIFLETSEYLSQALGNITDATEWVGNEIDKKTAELNKLKAKKQEIGRKEMRDFCRRTAEVMNAYGSRIEPEIPIYFSNFEKTVDALSNMLTISHNDFNNSTKEDNDTNIESIQKIITAISDASYGMTNFLQSIIDLPRMERDLNKAQRNVEGKLNEFINKLEISKSITIELFKNIPQE